MVLGASTNCGSQSRATWRDNISEDADLRGVAPEYILDAANAAAGGYQVGEPIPAFAEGENDVFRLRDFEGIAAEPVEPIAHG